MKYLKDYQLIQENLLPPDGAGNNRRTARDLGILDANPLPQTFFDGVGLEDQKDVYRFEISTTSNFQLNLEGLGANANVFLGDSAFNLIATSRNPGNASESISTTLDPGIYFVIVRSIDNADTTYELTLAASSEFIIDDRVVSDPATTFIPDPEFDPVNFQIAWQDNEENLWVAPVDLLTGDLLLEAKVLLDTGLIPIEEQLNGPEWAYSSNGSQIVYTKLIDGHSFIARAKGLGSEWEVELLTDETGVPVTGRLPFGSMTPETGNPLITYRRSLVSPDQAQVWRELDNPSVGGAIPGQRSRFVIGERAILELSEVDGVEQFFKFEVDTGETTQLTFDDTEKLIDAFMWNAPEFNNDQVFFVQEVVPLENQIIPQRATQLGIYRDIEGIWTRINTITSPVAELPLINSPESFVFNGKSYISLIFGKQGLNGELVLDGTESIWFVGIDPDAPFSRQVSGDEAIIKRDPEPLITEGGAFIYYTDKTLDNTAIVRRADTGLGLPDLVGNSQKLNYFNDSQVTMTAANTVGLEARFDRVDTNYEQILSDLTGLGITQSSSDGFFG